ncbi:MAG: hypothetical protein KDF67_12545, partial [Ottowia sp.]|nr:hypothetical protein [Ottowia sp.]
MPRAAACPAVRVVSTPPYPTKNAPEDAMSDSAHEEAHTGPIQTPKQLFWVSLAAFVVPVLIIIGLVAYVTSANKLSPGATDDEQAIAMRL